jgi:hypothetical protein
MMRSPLIKGLLVAALHVGIVASLGAKLLVDRATRPRVWARMAPIDPDLPIRGRYVRMGLEAVPDPDVSPDLWPLAGGVMLRAADGRLIATPAGDRSALLARLTSRGDERVAVLTQPVAFFIPEHIPDPSIRLPGEEFWVEVTIPRAGPPRPIQLGVKRDGVLTPLALN